jgi:hypothetical protein
VLAEVPGIVCIRLQNVTITFAFVRRARG